MKKIILILTFTTLTLIPSFYAHAALMSERQQHYPTATKLSQSTENIVICRSPGGCSSEQCCHDKMQQCYDNGGNEECSDAYERCVNGLN